MALRIMLICDRTGKRIFATVTLLAVVFLQLALATHACPTRPFQVPATSAATTDTTTGTGGDCEHRSMRDGGLCRMHCVSSQQIANDPASMIQIAPSAPTGGIVLLVADMPVTLVQPPVAPALQSSMSLYATTSTLAPRLSIFYARLRI